MGTVAAVTLVPSAHGTSYCGSNSREGEGNTVGATWQLYRKHATYCWKSGTDIGKSCLCHTKCVHQPHFHTMKSVSSSSKAQSPTPRHAPSCPTTAGTSPHPSKSSAPVAPSVLVNAIRVAATKPNPFTEMTSKGIRAIAAVGRTAQGSPVASRTAQYTARREVSGSPIATHSQLHDVLFSMTGSEPVRAKGIMYHNAESPERGVPRPSK